MDIQHIIPRSWGKPFSRRIWRIENMACTCRACHQHTTEARLRFIAKMAEQYDMTWVREFGIVLEEETNV
uniref:Putative homing endonuclease n=1 Tax=viral metagenome TaxID=1070528 RepID=A0A6M3X4D3_9ZZZZ